MRKLQRDSYELCFATKPIRIESFHDQFRYTPETKNLGAVLLRQTRSVRQRCTTFWRATAVKRAQHAPAEIWLSSTPARLRAMPCGRCTSSAPEINCDA